MTEPSYEQRETLAKKMSLTAELTILAYCRHLGLDPTTIRGSPTLAIVARRAEIEEREKLREKLREVPGFRFL